MVTKKTGKAGGEPSIHIAVRVSADLLAAIDAALVDYQRAAIGGLVLTRSDAARALLLEGVAARAAGGTKALDGRSTRSKMLGGSSGKRGRTIAPPLPARPVNGHDLRAQ